MDFEQFVNWVWAVPLTWIIWRIRKDDDKDVLDRNQIEDLVHHHLDDVKNNNTKLEGKIDMMSTQLVSLSVTLARIDEKLKQREFNPKN